MRNKKSLLFKNKIIKTEKITTFKNLEDAMKKHNNKVAFMFKDKKSTCDYWFLSI